MRQDIAALVAQFVDRLEAEVGRRALERVLGAFPPAPGGGHRGGAARRAQDGAATARRRLQGQYIGQLRSLHGAARARVRAAARKDGVAAAVRLARQLRGG